MLMSLEAILKPIGRPKEDLRFSFLKIRHVALHRQRPRRDRYRKGGEAGEAAGAGLQEEDDVLDLDGGRRGTAEDLDWRGR